MPTNISKKKKKKGQTKVPPFLQGKKKQWSHNKNEK